MKRLGLGVVGAGQISAKYLQSCTEKFNYILDIKAVADMVPELAKKRSEEFNIPQVLTVEELLSDPSIDLVLNLTPPAQHAPINLKALKAGKHVYTEKPFALSLEEANEVIELAESKGLLVGCAPDTFLGAGVQTCRKLIDDGWLGKPYAASATIIVRDHTGNVHPNVQNFLNIGGDPVLDLGPYYLTALVTLLGPIRRVTGSAQQSRTSVTILNPESPHFGRTLPVSAPTNVSATLDFHSGPVATLQAAKEGFGYRPRLEIYGTEGNLTVPDPNLFGGKVLIELPTGETKEIPHTHGFAEESRGIGVADMAYAIQAGRCNRASGTLARHVLEVSLGIFESSREERHIHIQSQVERPEPFPLGLKFNRLEQ